MQPVGANGSFFQRRPMDVEDYLNILRRNVSWILGPTLAAIVIAVVTACLWPNTYISTSQIKVVPPQVPERFVPTNINVQISERILSMKDQVLSRSVLTNLIETHDLYRKDRSRLTMEDVIEKMRKDIVIDIGGLRTAMFGPKSMTSFVVAFKYENRFLAQRVTRDLMTRFMDEQVRESSSQSQLTTQFLNEQLESA